MSRVWIVVLLMLSYPVFAGTEVRMPGDRVAFQQHLGNSLPLDQRFIDEQGRSTRLGRYFGHRPVVLLFAYYECPNLCDVVLNAAFAGLLQTGYTAGADYELVVVSIAPAETPLQAAQKKAGLLKWRGLPGGAQHAHFLTGQQDAITAVTSAAGFRYRFDPKLQQYAHAAGLLIIAADGRLSRYLYGVQFKPRDLRLALLQASQNRIGSPVDQLLLLCLHYDPSTGKYGLLIGNILRIAGGIAALTLAGFIGWMLHHERRGEGSV